MPEWSIIAAGVAAIVAVLLGLAWLGMRAASRAGRAEAEREQEEADADRILEARTIEQRYRDADHADVRRELHGYVDRQTRR